MLLDAHGVAINSLSNKNEESNQEINNLKIPIFVGVNDKEKLDQVLEIVKDDEVYEVAILSAARYKDLLVEYQFSKMSKEQQENYNKFTANEEAKARFTELSIEMYDTGIRKFNRDMLKQWLRFNRRKAVSNKEANDIIDCLFAFKRIEIVNVVSKEYERDYVLLVTTEDEIGALQLKQSAIKSEIDILNTQVVEIEFRIEQLKSIAAQTQKDTDPANDSTTDISGISDDIGQKSDQ